MTELQEHNLFIEIKIMILFCLFVFWESRIKTLFEVTNKRGMQDPS